MSEFAVTCGSEYTISDTRTLAAIEAAGHVLVETFGHRGRAFSCGNGGSMCDAMDEFGHHETEFI